MRTGPGPMLTTYTVTGPQGQTCSTSGLSQHLYAGDTYTYISLSTQTARLATPYWASPLSPKEHPELKMPTNQELPRVFLTSINSDPRSSCSGPKPYNCPLHPIHQQSAGSAVRASARRTEG